MLDPDQVRDARAWGDTGDLAETPDLPVQYPGLADSYRQTILNMRDVTDDWGWTVHGESWSMMNTHTTGSPRNRLTYFDRWVDSSGSSSSSCGPWKNSRFLSRSAHCFFWVSRLSNQSE